MTARDGLGVGVAIVLAVSAAGARELLQRDAAPPSRAGNASISGIVQTSTSSPRPLRRAIVSLHGAGLPLGLHTITNDSGQYVFAGLAEGLYDISASRNGFVPIPYGATRPGRPSAPIRVAVGQQVANVVLLLAPGAAVTGTVRDELGHPVPGLTVKVENPVAPGPSKSTTVRTDDRGVYRAFGLAAGSYTVSAQPLVTGTGEMTARSDAEVDAVLRLLAQRRTSPAAPAPPMSSVQVSPVTPGRSGDFVPVYHPSAFSNEDAVPVMVQAGEEKNGVDVTVRMMATSVIDGRIVNMAGRPSAEVELTLTSAHGTAAAARKTGTLRADGTFRFASVGPGRYLLAARALSPELAKASLGRAPEASSTGRPCELATMELNVLGVDLPGSNLTLGPCPTMAGRFEIRASATTKPPASFEGFRVSLSPNRSAGVPVPVIVRAPAPVGVDGRFVLGTFADVLPGRYEVTVVIPGAEAGKGWHVESISFDGRDITDALLDISGYPPPQSSLVVKLTDQHSSLSGQIETSASQSPKDYTVIVFPTNASWWNAPFRRIRSVRPSAGGEYAVHDLAPGEYLVAALTDLPDGEWRNAAFLSEVSPAAVRLVVAPGQKGIQHLRIAR